MWHSSRILKDPMHSSPLSNDLLIREELRYLCDSPQEFVALIHRFFEQTRFSDQDCAETIYFDNDEHVLPFIASARARRYCSNTCELPTVNNDQYFLEFKLSNGVTKTKERVEDSLEHATELANERGFALRGMLRPYVAIQYHRNHYVPRRGSGMRVTVDTDIRYFFFPPGEKNAIAIGHENHFGRVEIKDAGSHPHLRTTLSQALDRTHSIPIISKHFTAYRFLHTYRRSLFPRAPVNEFPAQKIKTKLECPGLSERLFHPARDVFAADASLTHTICPTYPYVAESARIHRYHLIDDYVVKALVRGNRVSIITPTHNADEYEQRGNLLILNRSQRKEFSHLRECASVLSSPLAAEIESKKKMFWLSNRISGRIYRIALDRSTHETDALYQIEVEYQGAVSPLDPSLDAIGDDIEAIAKRLTAIDQRLTYSQRTKSQWLDLE